MKKTIILLALAVFFLNSYSQEKKETKTAKPVNVPETVKKAFATQFPTAAKVEWGIEKPGEYEAEFKENNTSKSVLFNKKGTLLETESIIPESELPQPIKAVIAKDYSAYKIGRIEKNDVKGVVTYELSAKKDKKKCVLIFNPNGKFLKQE